MAWSVDRLTSLHVKLCRMFDLLDLHLFFKLHNSFIFRDAFFLLEYICIVPAVVGVKMSHVDLTKTVFQIGTFLIML